MALFYYQALERNGRKTKGMIEADSARHARQLLRGKELIPVHIEARMNTSSGGMLQRRRHAHRRVAAADLALFTRQLATLVQAAMPLETCLQAVSEQSEKLHVKSLGMALRSRIQEGYTLSDSLREHPRVFDSLFCSMVAAGEKSGHLDVVLNRLADYTEQRQRLKSRLLQAMLYPLVLLVVATGVVTILLTAVVPKIIEQFDHLGQKEYALELQRRRLTLHDIELELQKEAKKKTPQIRFSPFEPATPFTLRFYSAAQNACWAVKLAHDGALSLNQCDERMP